MITEDIYHCSNCDFPFVPDWCDGFCACPNCGEEHDQGDEKRSETNSGLAGRARNDWAGSLGVLLLLLSVGTSGAWQLVFQGTIQNQGTSSESPYINVYLTGQGSSSINLGPYTYFYGGSTLAVAAGATVTFNSAGWTWPANTGAPGYWVCFDPCSGQMVGGGAVTENDPAQTLTLTGTMIICTNTTPPAACYTNLVFSVTNTTKTSQTYAACMLNDPTDTGYAWGTAGPGQAIQLTVQNIPCTNASLWGAVLVTGTWAGQPGGTIAWGFGGATQVPAGVSGAPDASGSGQSVSGSATDGAVSPYSYDNTSSNDPSIIWRDTNTTSTANSGDVVKTLQDVGKMLFDSGVSIGQEAHTDAQAIRLAVLSMTNANTAISTASNVWVQNFPTNIPFPTATFVGISNLLAQAGTNGATVNLSSLTNSIQTMQTNLAAMLNQVLNGLTNGTATNNIRDALAESTLGGMSNLLSQFDAATNSDIATETGQMSVSNLLQGIAGNGTNLYGMVSNLFLSSSNGWGSVSNRATESTLRGISNLLANWPYTNQPDTNATGLGDVPSTATNGAAASSAAAAIDGDYGVDGVASSFGSAAPPADATGAPNMTMTFCGQVINFDPNVIFPGVSSASYIGFSLVLVLAFMVEVSRLFWNIITIRAQTQTGGVPDMDVLGVNAIGVGVAVVVPAVFLGLFVAAMAFVFSYASSYLATALNVSAFTTALGSIGFYLLSSFFPVHLFFTLIFTRLTISFTAAKMVAFASAAARFLFGR